MDKCNQVLDYASTHPNATISVYLVLLEACSLIAGYYYFANRMLDYSKGNPTTNGPILTECKTLKNMVSSSDQAKTCVTFKNAQNVTPLRHMINTVYLHYQPTKGSPTTNNNLTYQGILTRFIKPRK